MTGKTTHILVVDDTPRSLKLLSDLLCMKGYDVQTADSGEKAIEQIALDQPDLVLLDVLMPGMSGYDVCRHIRQNPATAVLPVIMVTALDPNEERVRGLEAGADDFLSKPIHQAELLARVRSLLRIKQLFEQVQKQAAELESWNQTLEQRVQQQVSQIRQLERLKYFLSPPIAELIMSSGYETYLRSHRRFVAVVFCDLRGFTAFSEAAEPEDVMAMLTEYHRTVGNLISRFEGTIDHRAGDGLMIYFNDPIPCEKPVMRAIAMAMQMREQVNGLVQRWRKTGYELGFGMGIAAGHVTIGLVGFEDRFDYIATGRPVNFASRLCDEAGDNQILINQRVFAEVDDVVEVDVLQELNIKGFQKPVVVFNVKGLKADGHLSLPEGTIQTDS
jgi:DNA-binding response OmpR family regulator